ncbi:Na+/H+ antiporter NhaC family protein [soil metagenome]
MRTWIVLVLLLIVSGPFAPCVQAQRAIPEASRERAERFFDTLDRDEDGELTREETPARAWQAVRPEAAPAPAKPIEKDEFVEAIGPRAGWFGIASLMPAAVALTLAFWSGNVLLSLFAGVVAGSVVKFFQARLVAGAWLPTELNFISDFFLEALGTRSYATILLIYLWFLGGILGIWSRTGAAKYFAERVGARIVRGPKTARLFAWIIGCVFHQGGTVSTVLAGTTVKPVADRNKVSHEELAYIVDSTASPVATVLPFNAWPAYVGGILIGATSASIGGFVLIQNEDVGIRWFFQSIFFNFYGMLAVLFTLLFSLGLLPYKGRKMSAAIERARTTGKLDAETANPLMDSEQLEQKAQEGYQTGLEDFFVPLGVLLTLAIIPLAFFDKNMINEAFFASTASAILLATAKGMKLKDAMDGFLDGCKNMTVGAIILGLAVTLGQVSKDLDSAGFVITSFGGAIPAWLLPAILTLSCMIIAFSIGSSWGTYAVIFPIALPLALTLAASRAGVGHLPMDQIALADPVAWASILYFAKVCSGAVIGGAVFGDQCSPISDTTVLSSMFTGCDVMDHVKTQCPIALVAAGIGMVLSTLFVLFR